MPDIGLLGGGTRKPATPQTQNAGEPREVVSQPPVEEAGSPQSAPSAFASKVAASDIVVARLSAPVETAPVAEAVFVEPPVAVAPVATIPVTAAPIQSPPAAAARNEVVPPVLAAAPPPIRWGDLLWLALALVVIVGTGIGVRDPWPADEPRFASLARDMVLSGEWMFPRVGGDLYQDKPPLFFWLLAIFYSLTASVRWSFLSKPYFLL